MRNIKLESGHIKMLLQAIGTLIIFGLLIGCDKEPLEEVEPLKCYEIHYENHYDTEGNVFFIEKIIIEVDCIVIPQI